MQKLLLRRTLRDLKANIFRYLTLFLFVFLCMFIVVGVVGSAESVIQTVHEKARSNSLEDGQFGVLAPLLAEQLYELEEMDVVVEESFYMDFKMGDGSTLRIMKNREKTNLVEVDSGRLASSGDEILMERIYATAHNLTVDDRLTVAGTVYTICGTGTSPDYDYCLQNMSDISSDGKTFGTAFVSEDTYNKILARNNNSHAEEYRYSYRIEGDITDKELKGILLEIKNQPGNIKTLTDFIMAEDNPRIMAANRDVDTNVKVGLMAGAIVLVLITYVISVFVVHSIDQESAMIGALYALGLKHKQLMLHYTMLPVLLCLMGGTVGTLLGYSKFGLSLLTNETYSYYSIPTMETYFTPWLLVYGLVLPPLIAYIVNRMIIRKRLCRPALTLLRKEQPKKKANNVLLNGFHFIRAFQIRQFLREKRSCFAVLAGMFVSLLILILGLNCYALCQNVKTQNSEDTKYTYRYQYKYPDETIPEGGYEAFALGLKKSVYGFDMEVSIIGLADNNPFFPKITSNKTDEISISSSVANKYGLLAGDELILNDNLNEKQYRFNVKEIVPYSVGLCCFMDLGSMRALFDMSPGYYNVVFSDRALDLDSHRIYAVSTKSDVEKSSDVFMKIMVPLMVMLTSVSIFIFIIVMYQMMKVMIDRSSFSISLMKIFGFRNREIRKLYLDGNFLLIALCALAMIPLAKCLMDMIYPSFVSNVACGVDLSWPSLLYIIVYSGILMGYLVIRTFLMHKVKKLAPADILKERE